MRRAPRARGRRRPGEGRPAIGRGAGWPSGSTRSGGGSAGRRRRPAGAPRGPGVSRRESGSSISREASSEAASHRRVRTCRRPLDRLMSASRAASASRRTIDARGTRAGAAGPGAAGRGCCPRSGPGRGAARPSPGPRARGGRTPRPAPRESAEAAVEDLPELALLERLVGRLPGSQAALPQAVGSEESVADRVGASARGELGLRPAAATRR